jgi:hypothetical protein
MTHSSPNPSSTQRLIITAASENFGPSLLALLGSIHLNWQTHPAIRVYDLGMDAKTLETLAANRIEVVKVPPFCPHWRKHFTWKLWCLNDAPAAQILWMDAGFVVMEPLDEVFSAIERLGYFLVPNYHLLDLEASDTACRGCGLDPSFRLGKPSLSGGLLGFLKEGKMRELLLEALTVALEEENIKATKPAHRHDQAILSLLMYKYFKSFVMADSQVYLGYKTPEQVPGQKIWVHRRGILAQDIDFYSQHISVGGTPRKPLNPSKNRPRNPFILLRRFLQSRYRRLKSKLEPPRTYDGVR